VVRCNVDHKSLNDAEFYAETAENIASFI